MGHESWMNDPIISISSPHSFKTIDTGLDLQSRADRGSAKLREGTLEQFCKEQTTIFPLWDTGFTDLATYRWNNKKETNMGFREEGGVFFSAKSGERGEDEMNSGARLLFTASQRQELDHQALIFKYMMAGVPVPPDLLLPIWRSFESMAARFYNHSTVGYYSFYGKKPDLEPGRCKRTDGKKWRCSKDACPNSKYCERHMHRGRNRSRKPVETKTISQYSSIAAPLPPTGSSAGGVGRSSFHHLPLHSITNSQGLAAGRINYLNLQIEPEIYEMGDKEYRYPHEHQEAVDHISLSDALERSRGLGMDFTIDTTWRLMP